MPEATLAGQVPSGGSMKARLVMGVALSSVAVACGDTASIQDCKPLCDWWYASCSAEMLKECIDSCTGVASEDLEQGRAA